VGEQLSAKLEEKELMCGALDGSKPVTGGSEGETHLQEGTNQGADPLLVTEEIKPRGKSTWGGKNVLRTAKRRKRQVCVWVLLEGSSCL